MKLVPILTVAFVVLCLRESGALAQTEESRPSLASRLAVSGEVGYAYPAGSTERGTEARDVSFGLLPLTLAGAVDLGPLWRVRLRGRYALNIPTLCDSGSDCVASVGHDASVSVGVGRLLPRWRRVSPEIDLEVGWEWLTTKLSDAGVASARRWNGPAASLACFVDLRSRGPWKLGPALEVGAGMFSGFEIDTPAGQSSGPAASAIHLWSSIAFRVERHL